MRRAEMPRPAKRAITGPARNAPRRPSCSTRPLRSSAPSRRDAVLFGRPGVGGQLAERARRLGLEHEREQLRPAIDDLRSRRCLELLFHGRYITIAARVVKDWSRMYVNEMPRYEILSEEAMDVLDRGWRRIVSELGIEFMLPEAVEYFRAAGQKVEGEQGLPRPRVRARAGRQGAARVRPRRRATRTQSRPHRRQPHGVLGRLRPAVRARGRHAARREDGRLRELRPARRSRSPSSTRRAARSSSPRTGRSTRATSTWSTRCRRCRTSRTWAR